MEDPPDPYDWEREPDYAWLDRFARVVTVLFLLGITIAVIAVLASCSLIEPPPTTTTTSTTSTTTTWVPDNITVPRPTTISP